MNERERDSDITDLPREGREEVEDIREENPDMGEGLGSPVPPVLANGTESDASEVEPEYPEAAEIEPDNPDAAWVAASKELGGGPEATPAEVLPADIPRADPPREPLRLHGDTHVVSVFGEDLGEIEKVYGYRPGLPEWASVKAGDHHVMVPIMSANMDGDELRVPYPKSLIESAPEYPEAGLSLAEEMRIYRHYNERRMLPQGADSEQTLLQPISAAA